MKVMTRLTFVFGIVNIIIAAIDKDIHGALGWAVATLYVGRAIFEENN